MLEKRLIRTALIDSLSEIQNRSGRELPQMNGDVHPYGDLDGFESMNRLEAILLLEQKLGRQLDRRTEFFKSEDGTRNLTIEEIVARLHHSLEAENANA